MIEVTDSLEPTSPASPPEFEPTGGSVTFVGSGPADLGLLTLSGSRAMRFADLLIVDPAADVEQIKAMVPAHAEVRLAGGDDEVAEILRTLRCVTQAKGCVEVADCGDQRRGGEADEGTRGARLLGHRSQATGRRRASRRSRAHDARVNCRRVRAPPGDVRPSAE